MEQQPNTESQQGAVPLDFRVRANFLGDFMTIEQIAEQVARDFQMVFGGIELDFALDVATRAMALERAACAQYIRDAAEKIAPDGKRVNQIDRHVAYVLACKADELAARANAELCGGPSGPSERAPG